MLLRRLLVLLLGLCWLVLAPGRAADRGALFRVVAGGHTMYLFGTMHVGLDEFYPLEPRIMAAVENASTLALELDPTQPAAAMAKAVREHGMLRAGTPGYETLAPADKLRLDRLVRAAGLNAARAASFKPVLLACMLSLAEYTKLGYRTDLATDTYLARLARSGNKQLVELESVSQQLALLDRLAPAEQWRFLNETIASIEAGSQRQQALKVAHAWSAADATSLDALVEAIAADGSVSGRFAREVMIDGRNGALADKLETLLAREDNAVAAIGVLHLLGENSVPALLRARGIVVERVY